VASVSEDRRNEDRSPRHSQHSVSEDRRNEDRRNEDRRDEDLAEPAVSAGSIAGARYGSGAARAAVIIAVGWHVGNDLTSTLLGWSHTHPRGVAAGVWLAFGGVLAYAVIALARGRRPGRIQVLCCLAVLLAGSVVLDLALGTEALFTFDNWAWGAAGWIALLVLWQSPVAAMVEFVIANICVTTAVIAGAGHADRVRFAMLLGVAYGTASLQLAMLAGARAVTATARRVASVREARDRIEAARVAAEQAQVGRRRRYATARAAAEDLLSGLANGALDPADPAVRARCAVAAARLRRLVTETEDVPDPLLHDLRAAADMAERSGAAVTLDLVGDVPDLPDEVRRALVDAPAGALAAARGVARVTVVSTSNDVSVAVLADGATVIPDSAADPAVSLTVEQEEGQLWVQARWRNESPQRSSTITKSSSTASVPGQRQTRNTASTSH
jgi:hypothetical protein